MPLGQVLIEEGVITRGQLTAALQRQVDVGGRLGTNLIDLGWATVDQIARGLARLHGVPAALERHLAGRDPELARALPRELARRLVAIPVATSRSGGVVVCMRDPTSAEAIAALRKVIGHEIIAAVAPERAIQEVLALAYRDAARDDDDDDGDDGDIDVDWTPPPPPGEYGFSDHMELVELDHRDVSRDDSQAGIDVRKLGSSLDAGTAVARETPRLGTAAITPAPAPAPLPPVATITSPVPRITPPFIPAQELAVPVRGHAEAIADLADAGHRDDVADALMGFVRGAFAAGVMLLVKDAMALGLRGFGGSFTSDTVESIVVPLSPPSLFKSAADTLTPFVGFAPVEREGTVQERFFKLFPPPIGPRPLALVPVAVRGRVVCLVYAHGRADDTSFETAAAELIALARAAGEAYVRILRAAKQK
jgi:hypothetical protein